MCSKRVRLIYNGLSNAQGHVQWTCRNVSSNTQGHVRWTCHNVLSNAQGTVDMCLVIKRKVQNGWDARVATWLLQPPHPQGLQLTRPCCASHQHPMTTLLTSCLTLQICMVSCDKREPLNSTGLKLNCLLNWTDLSWTVCWAGVTCSMLNCVELHWHKLNCLLSWTDLKLNCLLNWSDFKLNCLLNWTD